jgi:hypothetical protein
MPSSLRAAMAGKAEALAQAGYQIGYFQRNLFLP